MQLRKFIRFLFILIIILPLLGKSTIPPANRVEQIRAYTRGIEFDYVSWIFKALVYKTSQGSLAANQLVSNENQIQIVREYLTLVRSQRELIHQVTQIYANPNISDHQAASEILRTELARVTSRLDQITPLTETILQAQLTEIIVDLGLSVGGQPVPPVWYHVTSVPLGLIISPREVIHQEANITIDPDLNIDQIIELEDLVGTGLDLSAYVAQIGGIGVYPTMVYRTSNLNALLETIAHEWIHNYLTLRPLGVLYDSTPELRTMNETTASIAGKEIADLVIERYYPENLPRAVKIEPAEQGKTDEAPVFSFNREMHRIRVEVDALLAQGQVDEAEAFMEASREIFLENGYLIRKLNQAYFAFHGAYADEPGAAGTDPVGPAVRKLREQSDTLAGFLSTIARMTSFQDLLEAVSGAEAVEGAQSLEIIPKIIN